MSWLREAAFREPITFKAGELYRITWNATGSASFRSRGVQDGTVSAWYPGLSNRIRAWSPETAVRGRAEISTNGGSTWIGPTLYDKPDRDDVDVSYYFRLR